MEYLIGATRLIEMKQTDILEDLLSLSVYSFMLSIANLFKSGQNIHFTSCFIQNPISYYYYYYLSSPQVPSIYNFSYTLIYSSPL